MAQVGDNARLQRFSAPIRKAFAFLGADAGKPAVIGVQTQSAVEVRPTPQAGSRSCPEVLVFNQKRPQRRKLVASSESAAVPVRPAPDLIPTSRPVSHRFPPSILPTLSKPPPPLPVPTPADFNTPASLHSICIRTASAAPAASF